MPPTPASSIPKTSSSLLPTNAPHHSWFTSPARSHANSSQGKELPLHLIQLILEYLDDAADLARATRTSRLFYYMTLPRLYQNVTLRSYTEIRYVDDLPVGYGGGSPFAMGLNTLVTRTYASYIETFRVIGEWQEHDADNYTKGRVPDNSMVLQIAMRAALDKMPHLQTFAWELNTKPLHSVYEGLMHKPSLTTFVLRCPSRRLPRPTTVVPPFPNLKTLIVYDIDPLCYPDNISLILLAAKKLDSLKLHWNPRIRETGEASVNLHSMFGRCVTAKHRMPLRRLGMYNMYAANDEEGFQQITDPLTIEEMTIINCFNSRDPSTIFLDDTWKFKNTDVVPPNLKMMRVDNTDKEHVRLLHQIRGLERLYIISDSTSKCSASTTAPTPTSPSYPTTPAVAVNGATSNPSATSSPQVTENQCKSIAGDYLAAVQSNHTTMRHLLLSDRWSLSASAIQRICQACPNLEQLGIACEINPHESVRLILKLCPKIVALRILFRFDPAVPPENHEFADEEVQTFMLSSELWRPEYMGLKYLGVGYNTWKLGKTVIPRKTVRTPSGEMQKLGPFRNIELVDRKKVDHIEIWGMDSCEFEAKF
ncbi:hypothetical protein DM02DRAFT_614049 [Periconia macrospinosa]|uniref:F-box domain-containing protein n=1 Tax=Periconia macrospinosa TaxID=97972 RepID=A0A2V1DS11_9PLEO|nr:hypothetical protein DM02DRAFT_614049 [Periconia macrospinosa]